ncbi:MAG: hypothetical protein QOH68_3406 [Nocardioidaceae bacterium]|nr:hypothetical protein [Nocardioidaceae bacterium]
MLGLWAESAQTYLVIAGAVGGVAFAIPLFLMPLTWARAFRWNLPEDTDLALYFGRCLGALAVVVVALYLRAGLTGENLEVAFQVLILSATLMVLIHIVGAFQRVQPLTETIEIGFWLTMAVLGVLFYPA